MVGYDLFDLVGLSFDPPEKVAKKVTAAIDRKTKELNGELGSASQQLERDDIIAKIAFLETTASTIIGSDKRLSAAYEKLAEERTNLELKSLSAIVSLLKQSGSSVITNGTIRMYRQKTRLSEKHVEDVFKEAGFTITNIDPLKAMPKFPTNADRTYKNLEALRQSKDPNPNGANLTLATDLYAFTAYLAGEPESAVEYRGKSTPELMNLLDGFAKQFAMRNDRLGKLCASLATDGKAYVFNTEANRQAYETYLQYKSPALTRLFSSMGSVSKSILLDARFAEECIRQISALFGDYDTALAIYNKEAGLKDEPYIPEKPVCHIQCRHCQKIVEFDTMDQAKQLNRCSNCGKSLFVPCRKCHRLILGSLDKCPECGFVFASAEMFTKYFSATEQALRKSDFESARNFLLQAQSADPGEKARTDAMAKRISQEEEKYKEPINELRKLIAGKRFEYASKKLAQIIGAYPSLNVDSFQTQINTTLSQTRAAFARAGKLSPSTKADECLAILQTCIDFEPAIQYLQATPPQPCGSFAAGINSTAWCINISWTHSAEQGISYRLVRKPSTLLPANEKDGDILADSTQEMSYQDKNILPGQSYSYAVFAIRREVFSTPVGKTAMLLADVANLNSEQVGKTIRLTWSTPKNCTGVTITRIQNRTETVLTNNARNSFEDKDVQFGNTYAYKLCANYAGLPTSPGVNIIVTPAIKIEPFLISAQQVKDNTYSIFWNIPQPGIDLRICVNDQQVRAIKSDAGHCDVGLSVDGIYTITVLAASGSDWIKSYNSIPIYTYAPCTIDKAASPVTESLINGSPKPAYSIQLHLKIRGHIPSNVAGFFYSVRTASAQNRWPSFKEIGKDADIIRISSETYQKNSEILYSDTAQTERSYYVSLFTIYKIGNREYITKPSPCRIDRQLNADLFWKVSKSLLGKLKLSVTISGNMPILRTPALKLCACVSYHHLLSYNEPNAISIFNVPAVDLNEPEAVYTNSYEIEGDLSAKQLKSLKFFLFETAPIAGEQLTLRWAKGFSGKVQVENMAKFTCPFCMREYNSKEVLYVCPDCRTVSTPNFAEREPVKCKKHGCGGLATLRACPYCSQPESGIYTIIPKMALETPNLPFSIVGVANSGKTNYITVMLHELSRSSGLRIALGHQTKETLDRQKENYSRIYEKHTRPENTQSGENTPQIWYIRNLHKKFGNIIPAYTFTIFDGAGEDHENNLDPSSTLCRYISISKAIILAIDPLVLSGIRRGGVVDPTIMINSLGGYKGEEKNAEDVINSVAEYIKTARGIKSTRLLDIPVAVVLTKFDTVINHWAFGPQALIRKKSLSIHDGKVNTTEIEQIDGEIRNWLSAIGENGFINALESHFKEFYFFGVSSYGQPPKDKDTLVDNIQPHRVLDPMLWLFKRSNFID